MIIWIISAVIGLGVAWLAYGRRLQHASEHHRGTSAVLALLRAAAVTLVAALLLGAPSGRARALPAMLAIDQSASWRRSQGDESTTVKFLRRALLDSVVPTLASDVPLVAFGDSLREVSSSDLPHWFPDDKASRVRPAVDYAASLGRALILVTDGELDDPEALDELPAGSRLVSWPNRSSGAGAVDVALTDLSAPSVLMASDSMDVAATVSSGSAASPAGMLLIRVDDEQLAAVDIPALPPNTSARVAANIQLQRRGARTAILQALVRVSGDVEPRNDTLQLPLEVEDRPTAVFVSTAPDLDVREVLTVLRGALDVPAKAYLRLAPGVWRVEGNLAPVAEAEVERVAAAAGMLIVHGDTSWAGQLGRGAQPRALWVSAPPTAAARAGELARSAEWYVSSAPASPISAALAALPFDSLPPVTLAGSATGSAPGSTAGSAGIAAGSASQTAWDTVLTAQLSRRGAAVPAVAIRRGQASRTVVISGSGYAGWALRGGRPKEAFTALWGAVFDWLAAGRADLRAAVPVARVQRSGEPVAWRRGGADSLVLLVLTRRSASDVRRVDSIELHFSSEATETTSPPLEPGVYDVETEGGRSVLVINASAEWLPRLASASLSRGADNELRASSPRLVESGWPFAFVLLCLSGEWLGRRRMGQR